MRRVQLLRRLLDSHDNINEMVPHPPLIAALIAGEEFASKWSFLPFVERSLLNFCRIDIINVGGFTEAMKVSSSAHHYFSAWLSELRCIQMYHFDQKSTYYDQSSTNTI